MWIGQGREGRRRQVAYPLSLREWRRLNNAMICRPSGAITDFQLYLLIECIGVDQIADFFQPTMQGLNCREIQQLLAVEIEKGDPDRRLVGVKQTPHQIGHRFENDGVRPASPKSKNTISIRLLSTQIWLNPMVELDTSFSRKET